jgi:hypothetical protein
MFIKQFTSHNTRVRGSSERFCSEISNMLEGTNTPKSAQNQGVFVFADICTALNSLQRLIVWTGLKCHLHTRVAEHKGISPKTGRPLACPPNSNIRNHALNSNNPIPVKNRDRRWGRPRVTTPVFAVVSGPKLRSGGEEMANLGQASFAQPLRRQGPDMQAYTENSCSSLPQVAATRAWWRCPAPCGSV